MSRVARKYGTILTMAVGLTAIEGIAPAYADEIKVTSGVINFLIFDGASVTLSGQNGAELGGEIGSSNLGYVPPYGCFSTTGACAGQTVNLSVSDSLTSNPSGFHVEAAMIVDGVRYNLNNFSYHITAGNVVTPLNGRVTTPFTFMSTAVGTSPNGLTSSFDWTGAGSVTALYDASDGWVSSDYTFSQPSLTPEPSSVLLLGSAVAAGFFARRRSLLQSRPE